MCPLVILLFFFQEIFFEFLLSYFFIILKWMENLINLGILGKSHVLFQYISSQSFLFQFFGDHFSIGSLNFLECFFFWQIKTVKNK